MSTVTIFSTKGKKRSSVETNGCTTWGELKGILNSEGIETNNMKAIIGENQVTLESSKAILPLDFNFTLFLTPIKVKNGLNIDSMGYKECKEFIKANGGSEEFGNYTRMTTETMRSVITDYLVAQGAEEVSNTEATELVDQCIDALTQLKVILLRGTVTSEEDLVSHLEEWFEEINSNL